jgi:hypothetical protein
VGILVLLLVAAWGLVLGPPLLQTLGNSPLDTERMFRRSMKAMGRRPRGALGGRSILVPAKVPYPLQPTVGPSGRIISHAARSAAERRRRNLANLAILVIGTFVLSWVPGLRFLLIVNLILDVLLVLYLAAAVFLVVWPKADREGLPVIEDPAHRAAEGV